jgi:hypothetical protein
MILKILGGIDLVASLAFFMLIFGMDVATPFLLFTAGLIAVKGLFAFTGDVLSFVDLFSAFFLLLSIFFSLPSIFLWMPALLLLAKGVVSFF